MANRSTANSKRTGVLVHSPVDQNLGPMFNWNQSVIGVFFGPPPPSIFVVQHIVDSQWLKRDRIIVRRFDIYYCFFFDHPRDVEALVEQYTTVMDGRIITFRGGSAIMVPAHENFDEASLWVRVCGLPFGFLDQQWVLEALHHVGYVEEIDPQGFLDEPEFRAKVKLDLSKPIIPGCNIPLRDNQASWVPSRYEGVFKLCKKCGVVGHYTCNCTLSSYYASRWARSRMETL